MGLFRKSTEELVKLGKECAGYSSRRDKAVKYFQKAIDQGSAEAMYQMADMIFHDLIMRSSSLPEEAREEKAVQAEGLLKRAAELGYGQAMLRYGQELRYERPGREKDYAQALEWYMRAAELGGTDAAIACERIGDIYAKGLGVPPDPKEAVRWYEKGARSSGRFGDIRIKKIEPLDMDAAVRLYREGVEAGNTECIKRLDELQNEGIISQQNDSEYIRALEGQVRQGSTTAVARLAKIYETGDGVPVDREKALALYKQGCGLYGIKDLVLRPFGEGLWRMIETGSPAENEETRAWLKAAEYGADGNVDFGLREMAWRLVGRMWEYGYAPRKDYYQAIKWYCKAGAYSDEEYVENDALNDARKLVEAVVYFGGSDYVKLSKDKDYYKRSEILWSLSGGKKRNGMHIVDGVVDPSDLLETVAKHAWLNTVITPEKTNVRQLMPQLKKLRPNIMVVSVKFPDVCWDTSYFHWYVSWEKIGGKQLKLSILRKIAELPAE